MIIEFRVKNHRSFREEQTLSFVASNYDKSHPENVITAELPGLPDTRFVKAVVVYGPNAGGKSNLLLALRFLRWLVVESASGQKPEAKLPTAPFALDHVSAGAPTVLELAFLVDSTRYELAVAVTADRVVQERLVAYPSGRAQVWYDRVWAEESERYQWSPETPIGFVRDEGIVEKTRENALFLSTAAQWNNTQITPIYQWFLNNLEFLSSSDASPIPDGRSAVFVRQSEGMRRQVLAAMRRADLGLSDLEARDGSDPATDDGYFLRFKEFLTKQGIPFGLSQDGRWKIIFMHTGKGGEGFPLSWLDQSAGTRRFFSVLGPWFEGANEGAILCIDELETSLHPALAAELLRLFFNLTGTQSRAQLIITTHNPLLLDAEVLRRDQVWFADKNREGESFLYPLTDYKPRADESLLRGYLAGRYGAVPFIPSGLLSSFEPKAGAAEGAHAG